ncbi:MAG: lysylphosphatidylglycerol synthase transmembrane domain-containing protein [Enhydrobacter sp.]
MARITAGLLLLGILFYFKWIDVDVVRTALKHPATLAFAVLICGCATPAAALRWHILLRSQGLLLRLVETIRISFIAAFFGTFLPGGVGGDLVRVVYIHQATAGRRTSALLSIFVDRLVGLAALMLCGVLVSLWRPFSEQSWLEHATTLVALSLLFAIAAVLFAGDRILSRLGAVVENKWPKLSNVANGTAVALKDYRRAWPALLLSFVASLLVAGMLVGAVVAIAVFMQFGGLDAGRYAIAAAYGIVINSLPTTPGGLGVGESAFASFCVALQTTPSATPYGTIFLLFRCVVMLSALPGLLVYMIYPQRAKLLEAVNTDDAAI